MKEFLNQLIPPPPKMSFFQKAIYLIEKRTKKFKEFILYIMILSIISTTILSLTLSMNVIATFIACFFINFGIGFLLSCESNKYVLSNEEKQKKDLFNLIKEKQYVEKYKENLIKINLIEFNNLFENKQLKIESCNAYIKQLEEQCISDDIINTMAELAINSDRIESYCSENKTLLDIPLLELETLMKTKLANEILEYDSQQKYKENFLKKYATNLKSNKNKDIIFQNKKTLTMNL